MKDTTIQLLSKADAKDVLAFELANRAFFESIIPGRGDDYYSLEQVARSIDASLEEQAEGSSYMHLIRNAAGTWSAESTSIIS